MYPHPGGNSFYYKAMLITGHYLNNNNRLTIVLFFELFKKADYGFSTDVSCVRIGGDFFAVGMDSTRPIDTVPSCRSFYEYLQ